MRSLAALTLALIFVMAGAAPSSAAGNPRRTGSVSFTRTDLGRDGVCPEESYFPGHSEVRSLVDGLLSRSGPDATLSFDLCDTSGGALGGTTWAGTFTIQGNEGSLTGTVAAIWASNPSAPYEATLTPANGTRAYSHTTGRLYLSACPANGVFVGTLTSQYVDTTCPV